MITVKKSLITICVILHIGNTIHAQPTLLSHYNYGSASVLPVYTHRNIQYAILGREAYGKDRGTYDDFGGKRDPGENHPIVTAAREFWEEAILNSIGMSLRGTRYWIDISSSSNTQYIIAFSRSHTVKNVTYITNFGKYKTEFFNNFYHARNRSTKKENKEKDRIAIVVWTDLKDAIKNSKPGTATKVFALVKDPFTKKMYKEQITLRPYFVSKLRYFFQDRPYKQGTSKKIRFYSF